MSRHIYDRYRAERDRIEQLIAADPLWAAEELVKVKAALEHIEGLAHEDSSLIAHRALLTELFEPRRVKAR